MVTITVFGVKTNKNFNKPFLETVYCMLRRLIGQLGQGIVHTKNIFLKWSNSCGVHLKIDRSPVGF